MEYTKLGNTQIKVSKLCFGSLTISKLQANLKHELGVSIIERAFDEGVNFIDTAELYDNYSYIRDAIYGKREKIVISTKSYAYSKQTAEESLKKALKELNTDYIDIFSLHEQESDHTIRGHYEAIEYFIKAKEKGYIRAFGISTHNIDAVLSSLKYNEIEVLHPIYNKSGLGIVDGTSPEMGEAIRKAYDKGKGIYVMKPFGGGNLIENAEECLIFLLNKDYIHSIAIGMQSVEELLYNSAFIQRKKIDDNIKKAVKIKKRRLLIDFWCIGCGNCVSACSQDALSIVDGKAKVNNEKCLLCGYCSRYCKEFCIKII